MRAAYFAFPLALAACHDLTLPGDSTPQPGTLRANVVVAQPGSASLQPAVGATATLLGTTLTATADTDGNLALGGIRATTGQVLVALADHSRVIDLKSSNAGLGKDVNLGTLVLGRNATVKGTALRADLATGHTGHGGIQVFVTQGPWLATTGDDGSWQLDNLPEGDLALTYFAAGYEPAASSVTARAGEVQQVGAVTLVKAPAQPTTGVLAGTVHGSDGNALSTVSVRAASAGQEVMASTAADGTFAFAALGTGVYSVAFEKTGFNALRVDNLFVAPGDGGTKGDFTLTTGADQPIDLMGGPAAPDAGPTPDGGTLTLPDGGTTQAPVANAGPDQLANPGKLATLDGERSTGNHPLTYKWTQTFGPTVSLSANGSFTAFNPSFTCPATPQLLTFNLVVTDKNGIDSAPATTHVFVSGVPTAHFGPESGLYSGGQSLVLTSTSYDDGGLPIVAFAWSLLSGSQGSLATDGGAQAMLMLPAVAANAPDQLSQVQLVVSSSVGAQSAPFVQSYTARGSNPNNWFVDAGAPQTVDVGPTPPTVTLTASVGSPSVNNPQATVSWACAPAQPLVGANTLSPSFVAPVVKGAPQTVVCTVTATGAAPLDPATVSGTVTVLLRDTAPPKVISSSLVNNRESPFATLLKFDEPLAAPLGISDNCNSGGGSNTSVTVNQTLILGHQATAVLGASCGPLTLSIGDLATPSNVAFNLAISGGSSSVVAALYEGPYTSTQTYDDPRPVVLTLGPVPLDEQQKWSTTVQPYELVAQQANQLIHFPSFDLLASDAGCPCNLSGQAVTLAGLTAPSPAQRPRSFSSRGELLAMMESTAAGDRIARRAANGTWTDTALSTGYRYQDVNTWAQARVDGGSLFLDEYNADTQTLEATDTAATGLANVTNVAALPGYATALIGPTQQLQAWRKTNLVWGAISLPGAPSGIVALAMVNTTYYGTPDVVFAVIEQPTSPELAAYRLDANGLGGIYNISTNPIVGWDVVSRVGQVFVAVAENGDIRLKYASTQSLTFVDFPAVPRPGDPSPPSVLDVDPVCEAAYPRLAFVQDALVVTWQERCSSGGPWRIAARVFR